MKNLKMLGLAAVAAMALMAMVGAGTASATELCSTNTSPCTGTKYLSGTTISAQLKAGTGAVLTNSISNVTCKKSTVDITTTSSGGSGVAVTGTAPKTTGLTFSECTNSFGETCTAEVVDLPYSGSVTATGKGNGSMTVQADGSGNPGAKVVCGSLINCTFKTASATLTVTGGNPAIAAANAIELTREGGFCPTTSKWDAEYEVTAPKPLFVV